MTSLHQQHKHQHRLLLFPPFAKWLFFLPPLSLLYRVVVGVVVFVGVVVVTVMFKSLFGRDMKSHECLLVIDCFVVVDMFRT